MDITYINIIDRWQRGKTRCRRCFAADHSHHIVLSINASVHRHKHLTGANLDNRRKRPLKKHVTLVNATPTLFRQTKEAADWGL